MTPAAIVFAFAVMVLQAPAATAPSSAAAQPSLPTLPNDTYTYEPGGRRDPFVNLLGVGDGPVPAGKRGPGIGGMSANEVSVRGVMQSGSSLIALVTGPDRKTYIVKAGDRLLDGTIKTVNDQGLVIVQTVNDPLSLDKTREVRKLLRSAEDAK